MMWFLSTRKTLRRDDPIWPHYFWNHPYDQIEELRTIDTTFNPFVGDRVKSTAVVFDVSELADAVAGLPQPRIAHEYFQLEADELEFDEAIFVGYGQIQAHLLGYDLGEAGLGCGGTSSLTNCCMWTGHLEPLARSANSMGLLSLRAAQEAQRILPDEWPGDPHGITSIRTLIEIRLVH